MIPTYVTTFFELQDVDLDLGLSPSSVMFCNHCLKSRTALENNGG